MTTPGIDCRALALQGVAWKAAHDNIGIYPQVVHGDGGYSQRTERMEGWNECSIAHSRHFGKIMHWLRGLPVEHKQTIEDLLLSGVIDIHLDEVGPVIMTVNCNDLFAWGCADCEDLDMDDLPALCQAIADAKAAGSVNYGELLWVARKRKMRPQGAYYEYLGEALKPLFDACGDEREIGLGNPYPNEVERT